jgi:hypothetical protein
MLLLLIIAQIFRVLFSGRREGVWLPRYFSKGQGRRMSSSCFEADMMEGEFQQSTQWHNLES